MVKSYTAAKDSTEVVEVLFSDAFYRVFLVLTSEVNILYLTSIGKEDSDVSD